MFRLSLLLCLLCGIACSAQPKAPTGGTFAEKYYFLDSNRFFYAGTYAEVGDSIGKLQQKAEAEGDKEFAAMLKRETYKKLYQESKLSSDSLVKLLFDLAAYAHSNKVYHAEATVLQLLGDIYFERKSQQSEGIENYIAAFELYKNFTGDQFPPKQGYLYELGGSFYRYEDYESAILYMQQALKTKRSTNRNIYCSIFNTIGMAYRQMGIYDSAVLYFRKSHDAAVSLSNQAWVGISEGNIGITYFLQGKYTEAISLLETDIVSGLTNNNLKNAVGSMVILATIYNNLGQHDKAMELLQRGRVTAYERAFWSDYTLKEQLYTQLYRVYAAKNNFRTAYLYADSAVMAKDSASKKNNATTLSKAHEKMSYMQHKLEVEKLQNESRLQSAELSKKRIEITFTFIGIAALLLVVLFIARERKRSETLLLNILPEKIADRLKKKEHPIADYFDNASIIFIDMAGFTVFSDGRDPKEIVTVLNSVFTKFDMLAEKHGLEKIKTIGDCYMAVSGLPEPSPHHAEAATQMALEVKAEMKNFKSSDGTPLEFRIGLDCGPVVAGVIGRRKFIYDLWGDTVNTASRMESTGLAGEIHCSDRFKSKLEYKHKFVSKGMTDVKGKGVMETWLIME